MLSRAHARHEALIQSAVGRLQPVPAALAPENVAEPIGVIPLMSIRLELITVLPAPVSKSATILLPIGGKDVARVSGSKEYTSNLAAASSALAPFDGRKNPFTTGIHFL